nr:MAG TPA: hypothetical protein [Inoviridae sp.]
MGVGQRGLGVTEWYPNNYYNHHKYKHNKPNSYLENTISKK